MALPQVPQLVWRYLRFPLPPGSVTSGRRPLLPFITNYVSMEGFADCMVVLMSLLCHGDLSLFLEACDGAQAIWRWKAPAARDLMVPVVVRAALRSGTSSQMWMDVTFIHHDGGKWLKSPVPGFIYPHLSLSLTSIPYS